MSLHPHAFGKSGEARVAQLLTYHGRSVQRMSYKHPFDLLVDGRVRVEVKSSDMRISEGVPTWLFSIGRHGVLSENTDLYILRFERIPFCKKAIHMLLRAPLECRTVEFTLRGLLNGRSDYVSDFYSFARGGTVSDRRAA